MTSRPYTIHIYEEEAQLISKWTLQYPKIETGGDFFGLWLNENEVVIQLVLGPGRKCRRTTTSFFQDEEYLSNVGEFLTSNQGLCNIGSWHSHHTMNLPEPSRGDRDTVWRHLPTPGRFVLLIATIRTTVQMSFSLFESTSKGKEIIKLNISILKGRSPIRCSVNSQLKAGAEVFSQKKSYPEPRRKSRAERRAVARPHEHTEDQNITCDGLTTYNTFRDSKYPRPPNQPNKHCYYTSWDPIYNGRQRCTIYHQDYVGNVLDVGHCEICRSAKIIKHRDGTVHVLTTTSKRHPQVNNADIGCCTIL